MNNLPTARLESIDTQCELAMRYLHSLLPRPDVEDPDHRDILDACAALCLASNRLASLIARAESRQVTDHQAARARQNGGQA